MNEAAKRETSTMTLSPLRDGEAGFRCNSGSEHYPISKKQSVGEPFACDSLDEETLQEV